MKIWISILVLTLAAVAIHSCNSVASQNSNLVAKTDAARSNENIEFKGVSFTYDPQILGKVKAVEIPEVLLEVPDDKPDYVAPRHITFTFDLGKEYWKANVAVYPVEDFPRMYAVNQESKHAIEKEIEDLRRVLSDTDFRVDDEIPHLPYVDAGQSFQAKVRHFSFQNGSGILFVTHWSTEVALISNEHLQYMFEGLTRDGRHYIVAEMPIKVAFLPEDSLVEEFEGYKRTYILEDYRHPNEIKKRYRDYVRSISARFNKLPSSDFQPDLKSFEEMIASLKIAE